VNDFFPALLELIHGKIYGTDIPSVLNDTTASEPQNDETLGTDGVSHCTEFKSMTEAGSIVANLEQSSSATARYYFSTGLCSKCVKLPLSHGQLEHPQMDGQSALEQVVAVNGFAEH